MIELYTVCWNEEVRLPYFLRHYLQFVDKIILYDNKSTDQTRTIAQTVPQVEIRQFDTGNQYSEAAQMEIKNNAWRGSQADWVIVCDVDELLYHPEPRFLQLLAGGATIVQPCGYDMISLMLPTTQGQVYEEVTRGLRNPRFDKLVAFRPAFVEPNYTPGCHFALPKGEVRVFSPPGLSLLHFHYLSSEWTWIRHQAVGQRMSQENLQHRWGTQYLWDQGAFNREFQRIWFESGTVLPDREMQDTL